MNAVALLSNLAIHRYRYAKKLNYQRSWIMVHYQGGNSLEICLEQRMETIVVPGD